ncbi:hypothetical protein KY361_07640 [Candidatus Woesearchaeota archaeon]|nr:hypothetical protein [Candidatus Woesearchaeota archaeon]
MEKIKDKLTKIKIAVVITAVLVLSVYIFKNPNITGYVSTDFVMQNLNLTITQSQSFTLTSTSPEPFTLTAFKLTGEVIGDGRVEIYLDNRQGQQLLIYRNLKTKDKGIGAITGFSVEGEVEEAKKAAYFVISPGEIIQNPELQELSEKKETVSGTFENQCSDTCFIRMELSSSTVYDIVFKVESGTSLKINNIFYTIDVE